jgi:hypothetical protein
LAFMVRAPPSTVREAIRRQLRISLQTRWSSGVLSELSPGISGINFILRNYSLFGTVRDR